MDNDLMNDLDDLLAAAGEASPPPPAKPMQPPMPNNGMTSKGVKEVLGARLRDNQLNNEVASQKRKLEEAGGPPELLSKSQKMDNGSDGLGDNDFNSMVNGGNVGNDDHMGNPGGPRLLAQALMDKRPPNQQPPTNFGLRSPPPTSAMLLNKVNELRKENRHEEIKMLLDKNPALRQHYMQQQRTPDGMMMDQGGMNPRMGGMDGGGMMENPNFYNQPQQRGPMQPQMQRPPMGSPMGSALNQAWPPNGPQASMGGYNGGNMVQPPQRTIRPPPQGGRYISEVGPPPNAWVQPSMNGGPPPGSMGGMPDGPYYRNTPMRPMMRPQGMNSPYGDFPNGNPGGPSPGGQMYSQMRNYNMNSNGDPYGNTRFGSPNGVCTPMYSPSNGSPDPMIRMNNFNDNSVVTNGSYNNFNDFGQGPNGGPGYNNRVRPNFIQNGGPQGVGRPPNHQMMPFNGGRMGVPTTSGNLQTSNSMYHGNMQQQQNQGFNNSYNNMNNVNGMIDQQQQQQQQQQHHQQQPQHLHPQQQHQTHQMMNGVNSGGGPGDFDNSFSGGRIADNNNEIMEWKSKATEVRKSLLGKLKEALLGQNYPNAIQTAENFESSAFNEANTLNDYKYKLAQWLASIYDNAGPMASAASNGMPTINSPPDSSTNDQISDVTTSCNPMGDVTSGGGPTTENPSNPLEELLTPRSVSPAIMSPNANASPASSVASSNAITASSSPSSLSTTPMTTTTASSSPLTSMTSSAPTNTSNSTFQHPAMPPVNSGSDSTNEKSSLNGASVPGGGGVTPANGASTRLPPVNSQQPQQRRVSGSGALNTAAAAVTTSLPVSSISNNPQSVDSGIGLGSPRSITSASSSTLYSPKIQGTSPSLIPGSDNSPEKASSS